MVIVYYSFCVSILCACKCELVNKKTLTGIKMKKTNHVFFLIMFLTVRIVDGPAPNMGRVEVYHDNQWGCVCDDWWDMREAEVVCRQLGFSSAVFVTFSAKFGEGSGPIHFDDLECSGGESDLGECEHSGLGNTNCGHHEDAGVICSQPCKAHF